MIAGLRRRHRSAVALGWIALPLVLSLAWIHRPSTGPMPAAFARASSLSLDGGAGLDAPTGAEVWYGGRDLFEDGTIEVRFRASPEAQILTLLAENLLEPDLLIYWRAESTNSDDLDRSRLLGRWSSSTRAEVAMPLDWEGGGQLVLFSLGHMTVVARSRKLPSELP